MYTKHSEINDNLSFGNRTHGILFIQSVRSEVRDNTVIGNTKGIFIYNSIYNELISNMVMNNQLGIHSWGGSEDNEINGNSFINNEVQVKYVASKNQDWDNNYWSDYIGWDMTGDGIGDTQYESNSVVDHILWRYPMAKVLYTSPSLQMLWMLEKQFPVFDVPKVIDSRPTMSPLHANWKELRDTYSSYTPERIYGDIEKMPHVPGGGY
jgi:nitrous oxidase accessory protein